MPCLSLLVRLYLEERSIHQLQKTLIATGSTIFRRYQHLNWNDFYNSITFLYSVQMFNQMPTLINIAACARDPVHRDYSGTFYFIFVLSNNTILFNIFIGNIITICLEYFELEHAALTGKLEFQDGNAD